MDDSILDSLARQTGNLRKLAIKNAVNQSNSLRGSLVRFLENILRNQPEDLQYLDISNLTMNETEAYQVCVALESSRFSRLKILYLDRNKRGWTSNDCHQLLMSFIERQECLESLNLVRSFLISDCTRTIQLLSTVR